MWITYLLTVRCVYRAEEDFFFFLISRAQCFWDSLRTQSRILSWPDLHLLLTITEWALSSSLERGRGILPLLSPFLGLLSKVSVPSSSRSFVLLHSLDSSLSLSPQKQDNQNWTQPSSNHLPYPQPYTSTDTTWYNIISGQPFNVGLYWTFSSENFSWRIFALYAHPCSILFQGS